MVLGTDAMSELDAKFTAMLPLLGPAEAFKVTIPAEEVPPASSEGDKDRLWT